MPAPAPDLIALLIQAERLLARRLAVILDREGCSLDEWRVLTLLSDGSGHHMTEIAEHVFLPPATLTKLVDHLVETNLVYRRVDPLDRRRIRAYLTLRGRGLHQQLQLGVQESLADLPLPADDQTVLARLLAGLVTALTRRPATLL